MVLKLKTAWGLLGKRLGEWETAPDLFCDLVIHVFSLSVFSPNFWSTEGTRFLV